MIEAAPLTVKREYPINTQNLTRGSKIPPEMIEEALSVKRGTDGYDLARLKIAKYIMWRLAEDGLDVICCADPDVRHGLRILTEEERAGYTDQRFTVAIDAAGIALRQQAGTDRGLLSETTRSKHDRSLQVNGATYAGARRARREVLMAPEPVKRLTPGMKTRT